MVKIKVGLEVTEYYSYITLGYLHAEGLLTYVINPLLTNLYRKNSALKTKIGKVDIQAISMMSIYAVNLGSTQTHIS